MLRQQLEYEPFDYSDGALATESAGRWTNCAGYEEVQVATIEGNHYAIGQMQETDSVAVLTTWTGHPADHYAQQIYTGGEGGITLRSDTANNLILVDFVPGDAVYIYEVIGGVLNLLGTPLALASEMVFPDQLYGEIQGSTIIAKQNGTILGTREATGAIPYGNPGVWLVHVGSCTNWTAGDFQAPSPELIVGLV